MAGRYATQSLNYTLTNFAMSNFSSEPGVGEQIFPVVYVPNTLFQYRIFSGAEAVSDDYDLERAPKDEASEVERSYTSTTGTCVQYAVRELIANEEYDNADDGLAIEQDAVSVVVGKIKTRLEQNATTLAMNQGTYTNTAAAATKWDAGTTTIELDVELAKLSVLKKSGKRANTIVIPYTIASKMKYESEIRDLVKYTQGDLLVNGALPPVLWGLNVVIPTATQNEANPGVAMTSASYDFICDDFDAFVCYKEPNPSMRAMGAGYTFRRKIAGNSEIAMFKYYDEGRHGWWIEGQVEQLVKATCVGAGYVITAVDD